MQLPLCGGKAPWSGAEAVFSYKWDYESVSLLRCSGKSSSKAIRLSVVLAEVDPCPSFPGPTGVPALL